MMAVIKKVCTRVETDLNALNQVLSWFDQFNSPPVTYQTWLQCQLALVEGFTNAVRHAHRNQPPDKLIDLEVTIFDSYLEIRIWDWGPPFNLNQILEHLPEVDPDAEGGRGLKLMQRIADHMSYSRLANGQNCLLIVKCYPQVPQAFKPE